jgi:hypothetical protein
MAHNKASSGGKLDTTFGLIVLAVLAAGLVWVLLEGIRRAPEVVGSLLTALGAVTAVVYGRAWEKRKELEQARREKIAPVYSRMAEVFHGSMGDNAKYGEADLIDAFNEWAHSALLWAPAPVIRAFNEWRATLPADGEEPSPAVGIGFERLLYAFREDLGNKRDGLGEGDLLRVFINDIDDYLLSYRLQQAELPPQADSTTPTSDAR